VLSLVGEFISGDGWGFIEWYIVLAIFFFSLLIHLFSLGVKGLMLSSKQLKSYFHSKANNMHQCIEFILFWNDTLHVSDGLSFYHQEFKTVHTATGICQTDTAVE